jgi:segregation and condensation protein B
VSRMRQKRKARGIAARQAEAEAEVAATGADLDLDPEDVGHGDLEALVDAAEHLGEHAGDSDAEDDAEAAEEALRAFEAEDGAGDGEAAEAVAEEEELEVAGRPDATTLEPAELKALIEALLFAADKPLTVQRIRQLIRLPDLPRIQAIVDEIQADFSNRGLTLHEMSGGYLFRTHHAYSTWVQQLIQGRPVRLSRAQLETLSIVAYRQPITRPEIDDIRGVDSSNTLRVLSERSLVRILGKKEEVGRPLLYGTTKEFLDFFSLADLRELPTLREYSELSPESRQVMSQKLGELASDSVEPAPGGDAVAAMPAMDAVAAMPDELAVAHAAEPVPEAAAGPENDSESDPEIASS